MATSHADRYRGTGTSNVTTESKEDALTGMEFERFFAATHGMEPYYAIQCQFVALVCGQLGLRRGELAHLTEDWIEWGDSMIKIPRDRDCTEGKDGGPCGTCYRLARQRADRDGGLTVEEAVSGYWRAKSDAAARRVYFGFDPRIRMYFRQFFDRFDGWVWSGTNVNRRVNRIVDATDFSRDRIRPHSLRATAATHHAARGMDIYGLMQYFGWVKFETAEKYVSRNVLATIRRMGSWDRR